MTPEAQRITIAEACGWKRVIDNTASAQLYSNITGAYFSTTVYWAHDGMGVFADPAENDVDEFSAIPDYLNDLNAMHEAEKVLTDERQGSYFDWLSITSEARAGKSPLYAFTILNATASQRAEAFLRTLNLWTE